ncbi:MAG TPA: Gfo/Idh/MocA family oxidoreductase [Gemmatimonadales bacterium]|jgi:predicted dehydrogenase
MSSRKVSRREFVGGTASAALSAMIVPRHVLGRGFQAPSDTLNIAIVGCGGQGMENASNLTSQNIVALCDVDFGYVDRSLADRLRIVDGKEPGENSLKLRDQFMAAKRYADFRELLDKQKDIEALVVATPDHAHAIIAKSAMQLKKHVYVQKPLTHSVYEARRLKELARSSGVVTQMGNQGHSGNDARLINEWVQAGLIGPVHEVHVYTNRPIWPQGIPRPGRPVPPMQGASSTPAVYAPGGPKLQAGAPEWGRGDISNLVAQGLWNANYSPPASLNWELYTAPCAHDVAYHPIYHPFNWRGWTDFGVGALGDMGAHLIDHPYWALGLTAPTSIEATSTPWGGGSRNPASYPLAMTVHYEFAARGKQPPVRLSWYDGGLYPPRPAQLPDDVTLNAEGGVFIIGEKGVLLHETYGRRPQLFPRDLMQKTAAVPQTYPRITVSHEMNWVEACKGQGKATSPFEYASGLTETMLLGIVALRAGQGRKILYDASTMTITNAREANPNAPDPNQYLKPGYHPGWEV